MAKSKDANKYTVELSENQTVAKKLAIELAMEAQSPNPEICKKRDSIVAFGVNPSCNVIVEHKLLDVSQNAAQEWLDSDGQNAPKDLVNAVVKLSRSEKLTQEERELVEKASKNYARLVIALDTTLSPIGRLTTYQYDISESVQTWNIKKNIMFSGGYMTMTCQVDQRSAMRDITVGDKFYVMLDGTCIFWGICTKKTYTDEHNIEFGVSDPMWYLKNSLVWIQKEEITTDRAFAEVCYNLGLPCSFDEKEQYCKHKPRVETNTSGLDIIRAMLEEELIQPKATQYVVRMNPAEIELYNIEGYLSERGRVQNGTQFDVVDAMTSFTTTVSIEEDVYNNVKVFAGSGTKLKAYIEQDLPSIRRFGLLTYQEVADGVLLKDEDLSKILSVTKYNTSDLRFSILGLVNLFPGDSIQIVNSIYVVGDISYTYNESGYSMDIQCSRIQKPTDEYDVPEFYGLREEEQ